MGCHTGSQGICSSATIHGVSTMRGTAIGRNADHATNVCVPLIHHDVDVVKLLLGEVQEVETADPSTKHANSQPPPGTVEVIPDLHIRSPGRIPKSIM